MINCNFQRLNSYMNIRKYYLYVYDEIYIISYKLINYLLSKSDNRISSSIKQHTLIMKGH